MPRQEKKDPKSAQNAVCSQAEAGAEAEAEPEVEAEAGDGAQRGVACTIYRQEYPGTSAASFGIFGIYGAPSYRC